jgi:hypothetical protein
MAWRVDRALTAGVGACPIPIDRILDLRPKAAPTWYANILAMNTSPANSMASPPRRFVLLPEESMDAPSQGVRIRRYRLTSVARRRTIDGALPAARAAGDIGQLGRLHD